jgi:hypothetical protein
MSWPWKIALSLAWGLVLGSAAALSAGAMLLGAAWLYLFGDDPWPQWFDEAVLIGSAAAGLLTCAAVIAGVAALPLLSPGLDRRLQASAALRWTVLAIPWLLAAGAVAAYARQQAAWTAERAAAERQDQRLAQAHRLTSAEWRLEAPSGRLFVELSAEGVAEGTYSLLWEAHGVGAPEAIGSGAVIGSLPAGSGRLSLQLDASALARRYAESVLSRPEAVQIDLPLTLEFALAVEGGSARSGGPRLRLTVPLSFGYGPDGQVRFNGSPT